MKILFIYPNIIESPKDISTGLATLMALAKQKNHKIDLLDSTFGLTDIEIITKVKKLQPDLVAITTASNDFDYACHICELIKKTMNVLIIAGGFHPTIAPDEVISKECFDIIGIGECENSFLKLLESLNKGKLNTKIKSMWFKKKYKNNEIKIIKNPIGKLTQDLNSLPIIERDIFNYGKYLEWNHGTATFLSTRGCPYQCTYCINSYLRRLYTGKGCYIRFRSIDNLFKEIKQVLQKYGNQVKNIEFYDDTFTLDEKRIEEFCKRYPKEIGIPFNINARVNSVKENMLIELKKAGCVRVSIGIESGDEYVRNKVLKRNMTSQQMIDTFSACRRAGLKTYAFNMVGIPFETPGSIKKTIDLNRKCKPDYVGVSIFNAFRGTEAYEICEKNGWLKKGYAKSYFRDSNIKHPNFTPAQLRKIRNTFGFKVFLTYNPLRAIVDLLDREFSQINAYIFIRSKLIEKLRILRK